MTSSAAFNPDVDLDNIPVASDICSEGWHTVTIQRCRTGVSKRGFHMISLEAGVNEPHSGDDNSHLRDWLMPTQDGKKRPGSNGAPVTLSGGARVVELTRAIDPEMPQRHSAKRPNPDGFDPLSQVAVDRYLVGQVVQVYVEHEEGEWQGKPRIDARIRAYRKVPPAVLQALQAHHGNDFGRVHPIPDAWYKDAPPRAKRGGGEQA